MYPQVIFSAMEKTALIVVGTEVHLLTGSFTNTEAAENAARKQFPDVYASSAMVLNSTNKMPGE